ncbi:hypothetical protein [Jiangella mangrovi]|uniref:GNAT superfamily N-acetyltransferase n=1 Tax=Jiangella mangrovi TaxID=1524084 RepID=A0A7W9GX27_9ACTN|nr:hypothetical protein [Jiangella mangrovi]MBB5791645.1 GNAT superfamily N-acetyltransferase [Jiangella mangrovi]
MADLPANPMSIELSVTHRMLWWQTVDEDDLPEHWHVSADVWNLDLCRPEHRHVGDFSLAVADLNGDRNLLDSVELGEWALEFIAETVLDLAEGTLVAELDDQISDGLPRMVILRRFELAPAWRGFGLAGPLIAASLERFAATARLAVCRISPADFFGVAGDRVSAELTCLRLGALLERIGFYLWRGVYVVDLRNTALTDASLEPLERWGPYSDLDQ